LHTKFEIAAVGLVKQRNHVLGGARAVRSHGCGSSTAKNENAQGQQKSCALGSDKRLGAAGLAAETLPTGFTIERQPRSACGYGGVGFLAQGFGLDHRGCSGYTDGAMFRAERLCVEFLGYGFREMNDPIKLLPTDGHSADFVHGYYRTFEGGISSNSSIADILNGSMRARTFRSAN
jgi:hypothetical protein